MRATRISSALESLQLDWARVESLSEPGLSELIAFIEDQARIPESSLVHPADEAEPRLQPSEP